LLLLKSTIFTVYFLFSVNTLYVVKHQPLEVLLRWNCMKSESGLSLLLFLVMTAIGVGAVTAQTLTLNATAQELHPPDLLRNSNVHLRMRTCRFQRFHVHVVIRRRGHHPWISRFRATHLYRERAIPCKLYGIRCEQHPCRERDNHR